MKNQFKLNGNNNSNIILANNIELNKKLNASNNINKKITVFDSSLKTIKLNIENIENSKNFNYISDKTNDTIQIKGI